MADMSVAPPGPGPADEREDDVFAARLRVDPEQARKILDTDRFDFGDRPRITPNADGTGTLDLFVTRAQVAELQADGITVELGHNQSARARERVAELGEGDRYEGSREIPHGVGQKTGGRGGPGSSDPKAQERRS